MTGSDFSSKSAQWKVGAGSFLSIFPLGSIVIVEGLGEGRIESDLWHTLFAHECHAKVMIGKETRNVPVRLISAAPK